jgi:hypothetical protein
VRNLAAGAVAFAISLWLPSRLNAVQQPQAAPSAASAAPKDTLKPAAPAGTRAPVTKHGGLQLIAQAGPAFTGVRVVEQLQTPAYNGNLGPLTDSVDLVRNPSTIWRPAFAAGLEVGYMKNEDFGIGLALQMVTVTGNNGTAMVWPAATLHLGGTANQVFVGYMFGSSDNVVFPNGSGRIRVSKANVPDFTEHNGSGFGAFIIGITVGSVRVAGTDVTKTTKAGN